MRGRVDCTAAASRAIRSESMRRNVRSVLGGARRRPVLVAMTIGLAYLAVQLSLLGEYGVTWDEPLHQRWGQAVTTYFVTGDRGPLANLPGYGTYYGPLYYWASSVVAAFAHGTLGLRPAAALHVLNVVTASVGVALSYLVGRELAGARVAAFATGFLVLFPPFLAHSHYNPKDIPLLTVVAATMLFAHRALVSGRRRDAVIAGALFGAALTVKLTALFAGGAIALAYAARLLDGSGTRPSAAAEIRRVGTFAGSALAAVYALWPTAWADPLLVPRSVVVFLTAKFFSGTMLYFGTRYGGAELPWHYTPVSLAIVTPVATLLALGVGVVALARQVRPGTAVGPVLLLAWLFVPLAVSLMPGLVRYDGMRQFFFVVPALAVIAGVGLDVTLRSASRRGVEERAVLAALAIWLGLQVAEVHPFEGSYVNEAVRAAIPRDLERWLIVEGWGATYLQGVAWLGEHAEPEATVCVPIAGALPGWDSPRPDLRFGCGPDARYLMFVTGYDRRGDYDDRTPAFRIVRYASDLLRIYRLP